MGEIKPLGSEKLKGDEKLKRILEIAYYNADKKSDKAPVDAAYLTESINGVYGIVKEKDGYYVKKGLTENTLDYIGGLFMKNKNRFSSYGEALKRLELIKGQEILQEDTKYVLKVKKPTAPAATADEAVPPVPAQPEQIPDMGGETPDLSGELPPEDAGADMPPEDMGAEDELGGEDEFGSDYLKGIQKLTGKLGEKLRKYEDKIEGDDVKYVINSVLSALDLTKLEDTDKDDIISQIEGDIEDGDENFGDEVNPENEIPSEMGSEMPVPSDDEEIGEIMDMEELINTPFDFKEDNNKPYQSIEEIGSEDDFLDDDDIEKKNYYGAMKNMFDVEPEFTSPDADDEAENEDGDVCLHCHGTGVVRGKECEACHGEGVVYNNEKIGSVDDIEPLDIDDDSDYDPYSGTRYDPLEMGEQDDLANLQTKELENPENVEIKEIELSELTDMINNTVKETLGKYFE